jgi:hypothetical protein
MRHCLPSLDFASRLTRVCLVTFYTAIALLGSGGLHGLAHCCESSCCTAESPATTTHTHVGCTHPHHAHGRPTNPPGQAPEESPGHCPDGCLICEFAATPAVPVAIVTATPRLEFVETVAPTRTLQRSHVATAPFWSRGPPAVG